MRMIKIILLQFTLVSAVVLILELLSYLITGEIKQNINNLNGTLILFLAVILSPLIHERIVIKETKNSAENQTKIKSTLLKYRLKLISENNNITMYKVSKMYSWDGVVTIEMFEENIRITGPSLIIRKFKF